MWCGSRVRGGSTTIAWRFGIDTQVLDPRASGSAELGNWLRARVLPPRAERAVAA
jgi:hypothetical protein